MSYCINRCNFEINLTYCYGCVFIKHNYYSRIIDVLLHKTRDLPFLFPPFVIQNP